MKAANQQEKESVRIKTIRQELFLPHSAVFEYDLLRDAVGYRRQAFVPAALDKKARVLLNKVQACPAVVKYDWFAKAAGATQVGVFNATSTGSTLVTNWRGSATAGSIPDAIVGAHCTLALPRVQTQIEVVPGKNQEKVLSDAVTVLC